MFAVEVDGRGGDFDENTSRDVLTVTEGYALENAAAERC